MDEKKSQQEKERSKFGSKGTLLALIAFCVVLVAFFVLYQQFAPKKITEDRPSSSGSPLTSAEPSPFYEKKVTVIIRIPDREDRTVILETNAKSLRAALEENDLIAGEEGQFGLYVKTVDGVTADESKQQFWSFTKDGAMLEVGVDYVEIADGEQYEISLAVW